MIWADRVEPVEPVKSGPWSREVVAAIHTDFRRAIASEIFDALLVFVVCGMVYLVLALMGI